MAQSVDILFNARMNVDNAMKGIKEIQQTLGKIQMPKGLESSFEKSFGNLDGLIKKFNDQLNKGVKTKGDVTGLERLTKQIDSELTKIGLDFKKLTGQEIKFKFDTKEVKQAREELAKMIEERNKFAASQANQKLRGSGGKSANSLLDDVAAAAGNNKTKTGQAAIAAKAALNAGDIDEYNKQLAIVERYFGRIKEGAAKLGIEPEKAFKLLRGAVTNSTTEMERFNVAVEKAKGKYDLATAKSVEEAGRQAALAAQNFEKEAGSIRKVEEEQKQLASQSQSLNQNISQLESHVAMYFSFAAILRKVTQVARKAFQTVKELDKAMVETAVVTHFDVGDMWDMLPIYTKNANELGSTIKDVYEAATLYYQQGLNQAQAMGLANETLKMARIGGLQAAEATDMMTAALRGFNMQINEMSAQRINDVYSKLAAITASDTRELGSAMERTASIANSAGMAFETTSAFLAQMIETTREAPENLGTAMKTIVARFQEMKNDPTKLIDAEGEMLDANRVDKALKTIGVNLMDTNGQFRQLDDVFLEISQKWDGLSQAQQRYIATIAAGSRQQSRFIAMVQNYDRVMELTQAANNATGASQEQFNKTLEGLDAKLNKLKNAWDQFAMGLANNKIIKVAVDGMTSLFTIINKMLGVFDKFPDPFGGLTKSIITLLAVVKGMNLGGTILTGGVRGMGAWASGQWSDGSLMQAATPMGAMKQGVQRQFGEAKAAKENAKSMRVAAQQAGAADGKLYVMGFRQSLAGLNIGQALSSSKKINGSALQIVNKILPKGELTAAARIKAAEIMTEVQKEFQAGKYKNSADALAVARSRLQVAGINNSGLVATDKGLRATFEAGEQAQGSFTRLGSAVSGAGAAFQTFGMILSQTPLAPISGLITTIGFALITLGSSLNVLAAKTKAAALAALMHAAGMKTEEIQAKKTALANGEMTAAESKQAFGSVFQTLKNLKPSQIIKNIGASIKNVGKSIVGFLGPWGTVAAIGATIAGFALYKIFTKDARALKEAGKAAGEAADAYASTTQSLSELRDNLDKVREADAGFDGLVEGTAAFNEQLVKSNELILQLLNKYPMLYDYLTTDSNGRMKISDEGMEEVLKYQQQITSQAAALNTIKNGEYQALKTKQEEKQVRKDRRKELYNSNIDEETRQQRLDYYDKELENLQRQQDTYRQTSKLTAISTKLSGKELANQEAISQLYADQYDRRKAGVNLSKKEAYQAYADFYDYRYEGGKLLDQEGNKVDIKKEEVMDAAEDITVMADIELNADSLNKSIDEANKTFKENFDFGENKQGNNTFISDLLSKSFEANEDAIISVLKDDTSLQETASQMTAEQIAGILGVSVDKVESNLEYYQSQVVNLLKQNAIAIAKAQGQNYADLGVMLGKSRGTTNTKAITKELQKLSQSQRQAILQAGQALEKSAGEESMKAMVAGMTDIYEKGTIAEREQLEKLTEGVNWDSAIERYAAYNRLTDEGIGKVKELGVAMEGLEDSSELVAEAFEEAYDSADFQDALKGLDKFTDSLGHVDASDIKELSKESSTLNKLLESGAISTGGMARAMNLLHDNGDMTLMDLNADLLILIDKMGQVETAIGNAHNVIENFDPGIDAGESEDFFIEAAEKFDELFKYNEWGNPQLRAYTELIVGTENFNKELQDNEGDLEKTYRHFKKTVDLFKTGGYDAWKELANSTRAEASIFSWGKDGSIKIDMANIKSIEDLTDVLKENGYSEEAAQIMIEQYINYSPDFQKTMDAIAFVEAFNQNGKSFIENRTSADGKEVVVLKSDLQKLALGAEKDPESEKDLEEIKKVITNQSGLPVKTVNDTKKDMTLEDRALAYSKQYTGDKKADPYDLILKNGKAASALHDGAIDIKEALKVAEGYGFSQEEAEQLVWDAYRNSKEDFYYGDEKVDRTEIDTLNEWEEFINEGLDSEKWIKVGEDIAAGWYGYLQAHDLNGDGKIDDKDLETTYGENSSVSDYAYGNGRYVAKPVDFSNLSGTGWDWLVNQDYNAPISPQGEQLVSPEDVDNAINGVTTLTGLITKADDATKAWKEDTDAYLNTVGKPIPASSSFYSEEELENQRKEREDLQKENEKYWKEHPVDIEIGLDGKPLNKEYEDAKNQARDEGKQAGEEYSKGVEEGADKGKKDVQQKITNIQKTITDVEGKERKVTIHIDANTKAAISKAKTTEEYIDSLVPYMKIEGIDNVSQKAAWIKQNWDNKTLNWMLRVTVIATGATDLLKQFNIRPGSSMTSLSTTAFENYTPPGDRDTSGGGGGGGGGGNSNKPTINNFSIQEIIRYDAEKRLASYQSSLDKLEKTLEKNLEKIGITTSDISKNVNKQRSYLNKEIYDQKKVTSTYNKQLKQLDNGGYYEYLSWTDSTGQSHDASKYNLSNYIKKNKRGVYQIDTDAINATAAKVGGSNTNDRRAVREMLYKAAQGALDPLVSGLEDSKKKTQEYKEKLKELDQQVYDAFYGWENELTRIYDINQRIEQITKRIERVGSYVDLELARVGAGVMQTSKAINNSIIALQRENSSRRTQLNLQKQLINGEKTRLKYALSDADERAELKRAKKEGNSARIKAAKDALKIANIADRYTKVSYNKDGTADIKVNWQKLETDHNTGQLNDTTYQAVKEKIEEMIGANADLEEAIKGLNDQYAELYNQLIEYRQTIEDMEDTLLKQLEANAKKQIDNAKKLNTALVNALKNILETVKKRLQERRQKEDNAKTEQEISNKQQRLNLLRANTSGGNRVEIAQLEKEIADAQQSYRRTLEDQLLQKLQEQGDAAAKQRERQIEVAEAQLETQKEANKTLVYNYLLALKENGKLPKEAMELLKEANNYSDKGKFGSKYLLDRLEQTVTETGIALTEVDSKIKGSTAWTANQVSGLINTVNNINKALEEDILATKALAYYNAGKTSTQAKKKLQKDGATTNTALAKAMKAGGYSNKEIKQANISLRGQFNAGNISTAKGAKSAGYNARQAYAIHEFTWKEIEEAYGKANANRVLTDTRAKRIAGSILKDKNSGGWGTGKTRESRLKKVFGENQKDKILEFVNANNILYTKDKYTYAEMKKRNWYKYATGGLADYTGPAWLDGTPSKPEIVLNATDTKNFIQLRDILSSIMRGGAFDAPAYAAAGDTNFEININVDHIANDYDVDRIADRVKKQIVESSQYRNVNQVRRLR